MFSDVEVDPAVPPGEVDAGRPRPSGLMMSGWAAVTLAAGLALLVVVGPTILTLAHRTQVHDVGVTRDEVLADAMPGEVWSSMWYGDPAARLLIPSIKLDQVAVFGLGEAELRNGPALSPHGVQPGGIGKVIIGGHRDGWGSPFHDLGELTVGDEIALHTVDGARHQYMVDSLEVIDEEDAAARVMAPATDGRRAELLLFTCHPKGSTDQRLLVHASLADQSRAERNRIDSAWRARPMGTWTDRGSALPGLAVFAALASGIAVGVLRARRWRPWWPIVAAASAAPLLLTLSLVSAYLYDATYDLW